ncbi:hypothetical protein Vretimale_12376, partial [Volvox reticuliferus]
FHWVINKLPSHYYPAVVILFLHNSQLPSNTMQSGRSACLRPTGRDACVRFYCSANAIVCPKLVYKARIFSAVGSIWQREQERPGQTSEIYLLVLTLRVILTWFRNINWYNEPFATLRQFTDPFLNVFRGILPAFGGIDVSPMIGFLLLNFVRNQLVHLSRTMIL